MGERSETGLGWVWRAALGTFIVAGSTGTLYRMGLTYGWTAGLDLVNIRHAHSHLMYFGWVTPLLFALIANHLSRQTARPLPRRLNWILAGCFAAAALSYPLFLSFGYTPVALGSKRMPIAVIASTLNMFAWYTFVVWYVRVSKGVARTHAHALWDAALTFLMLATFGAGGLAFMKPLGIQDPAWISALTHVFLDFFSEGWFVLAVLGLAFSSLQEGGRKGGHWSLYVLCAGVPLTFALGMPSLLVPPGLKLLASIGGMLVAVGLLASVAMLWKAAVRQERWVWGIPLALLAAKALAQLVGSVLPGVWWSDMHGMRILYLHLMLLGFVSLGLVASVEGVWGRRVSSGRAWFYAAVCLVLVSLVPLSNLWPIAWAGRWAFVAAAWMSLLPIAAAAFMLAHPASWLRRDWTEKVISPQVQDGMTNLEREYTRQSVQEASATL